MSVKSRFFIALLALVVAPEWLVAQERGTITGSVVSAETEQPLQGVQVMVAGSQLGTITNQQGRFVIPNVRSGPAEVRASILGYTQGSQEVNVSPGGSTNVNFRLSTSALALEGVVVTATGEVRRRRELGNAVSTIEVPELSAAPITNMQELLTGRAANVNVITSSGTVGGGAKIQIRGLNSVSLGADPLLIIDGVRATLQGHQQALGAGSSSRPHGQQASRFNDLNPNDIESIEILKGPAAAAMYGTAAANGVIQITTKKGVSGTARWNAYVEAGTHEDPGNWDANFRGIGVTPGGAEVTCNIFAQSSGACQFDRLESANVLTDPLTTPFREGSRRQYGISASGGTEGTTYYLSGDFEEEEGVYVRNEMDRANLRANVRAQLLDNLDVTATSAYITGRTTIPNNDNNAFSYILNGQLGASRIDPDNPASAYRAGIAPEVTDEYEITSDVNRFLGTLTPSWRPTEWLNVSAVTGLDFISQHDFVLLRPGGRLGELFGSPYAEGFRDSQRFQTWNWSFNTSASASYQVTNNIASTTTVGTTYNREELQRTGAFGAGLLGGTASLAGTSSLFSVEEQNEDIRTIGALFRQQFAINDRIFIAGSIRGDDDSAFGSDFGLVTYPSLSFSWILSEEAFFPQLDMLSSLRLRTAWGRSGLRPGFRQADTYFDAVSVAIRGTESSALTVGGTGNPDLEPEKTDEVEFGFDLGLLNDRVSLEFTHYRKKSSDALVSARLAPSLGLSTSRFQNLGEVRNTGYEAVLNTEILDMRSLRLDAQLAASWNENELVELGEGVEPIIYGLGGASQRHAEGYPLGGYWQRPILGFSDANNDGLITPDEVQVGADPEFIAPAFPTRQVSLNTSLTLFDIFQVGALVDHKGGNSLYNSTEQFRCGFHPAFFRCREAFDPATPLEQQVRIAANQKAGTPTEYGFFEDADFIKLRELSFRLTAPESLQRQLPGIDGLSLTVAGRNIKTWTDYGGIDPEVSSQGNNSSYARSSSEFFTQPPLETWIARVNVNF